MPDPSLERTTSTMLSGLKNPANDNAWASFDARYRPILMAVAQRLGLHATDADEVAQETLVLFARDYREGKYDRDKGRLRAWIHGILRHRIQDWMRKRRSVDGFRGESGLLSLEKEGELEQIWEAECRQAILDRALQILGDTTDLQPITIEAFRRYGLEDQPAQQVANDLGLSARSVYLAKHRCAKGLKEIVAQLTEAYER